MLSSRFIIALSPHIDCRRVIAVDQYLYSLLAPAKAATMTNSDNKTTVPESAVRPSLSIRMIRHAESNNNQVYRNARYIYRGGTPEFDPEGWNTYVEEHRQADPGLSDIGERQAQHLANYLVPHLANQASRPVHVICSPMKRTLLTIRPTIQALEERMAGSTLVKVHGFYFESEGCHLKDQAEPGMPPDEIRELLHEPQHGPQSLDFVGFPHPQKGWYCNGQGAETRQASERRAAKFYVWLCEYLDAQLASGQDDVFDAGVAIDGEESEFEHDKHAPRLRRRRTTLLVGHGDFMSLILKRIVAGFGHAIENEGIPHRSAFVHFNTGITELEYFGNGRWLIMSHNQTPHLTPDQYAELRCGGSLKDGWSYLMPDDQFLLDAEVSVAFADELEDHVLEQAEALKALYLSSKETEKLPADSNLSVEEDGENGNKDHVKHFVVKRGLQVVGVATYSDKTGRVTDVAVRPSAGKEASETLFRAVKDYSRKIGRSGSLLILPRSTQSRALFEQMGFEEMNDENEDVIQAELKH